MSDEIQQVAESTRQWWEVGGAIGAMLAALGMGRASKRAQGSEDVVKALKGLEGTIASSFKELEQTFRSEFEKTRQATYKTAKDLEEKLEAVHRDTTTLLDRRPNGRAPG